eukprot:gene26847-35539_t
MITNFLKKYLPPGTVEKASETFWKAVLFRAEDPNNLHQILPPRENNTPVKSIKGYRYPAPGSRTGARIPTRESSDEIFNNSYYTKDARNLPKKEEYVFNTPTPLLVTKQELRVPSHGKRVIANLPYDPSGLRTTKTTTWEALDKVLIAAAEPDHLVRPEWASRIDAIQAERARKGLPAAVGERYKIDLPAEYNQVRW